MTQTESEVLESLNELEEAVNQLAAKKEKPNLAAIFEKLDLLTNALPKDADPSLLHYLHKKSYQKARLFLLGREAENAKGNCHGHSR